MEIKSLAQLPQRPRGDYLNKFGKTKLSTNLYKVSFDQNSNIHTYCVTYEPEIHFDNRSLRQKLLISAKSQLKDIVGEYAICGNTILTCEPKAAKESKDHILITLANGTSLNYIELTVYKIAFRRVRTTDIAKIKSSNPKQAQGPLNFLNNLIKNYLVQLEYHEIGKSGKYYTQKNKKILKQAGVMLYQGYSTCFSVLESGVYLKIDSSTRIVQSQSALHVIDTIYRLHSAKSIQEKRDSIRSQMIGKVVMANYGAHRYWIIEDVTFDINLNEYKIKKDGKKDGKEDGKEGGKEDGKTLSQYYFEKYGIKPTKEKQPLFKVRTNRPSKQGTNPEQLCYLVPEFVLISGLPDNFDEQRRRMVSDVTIIEPQEKSKRIESIISEFNSNLKVCNPESISQALSLKISKTPQQITAINLGSPRICLGENQLVESNKVASFLLFNKPLYQAKITLNLMVFLPLESKLQQIQSLMVNTSQNLKLKQKIAFTQIDFRKNDSISILEKFITDAEGTLQNYNIFWFVLPNRHKNHYSHLKKMALSSKNPKLTQMTLQNTLEKKGFTSICTKILLQMTAKIGNVLWSPQIQNLDGSKIMLIGIDTAKNRGSNSTAVAYCATTDKNFGHFYSNYFIQEQVKEASEKCAHILAQALNAYLKRNKVLPQQIIMMKNGCADSQLPVSISLEVNQSIKTIQKASNGEQRPKLTYAIVDRNVTQKLFAEKKGEKYNPSFGTLVNTQIISPYYDFYMVAQNCNKGTVKPTYFKVIHCQSSMEEGKLQELLYTQCFNYANWSGSVRVPGVLQYAKKLSTFVGQHINSEPSTLAFNEHLHYI